MAFFLNLTLHTVQCHGNHFQLSDHPKLSIIYSEGLCGSVKTKHRERQGSLQP